MNDILTILCNREPDSENLKKIVEFLIANPTPTDMEFHEKMDEWDLDHHKGEQMLYKLAGRFLKLLNGGKSKGNFPKGMDESELKAGMKVEQEHAGDDLIAGMKISADHITEDPLYYRKLKKTENSND